MQVLSRLQQLQQQIHQLGPQEQQHRQQLKEAAIKVRVSDQCFSCGSHFSVEVPHVVPVSCPFYGGLRRTPDWF